MRLLKFSLGIAMMLSLTFAPVYAGPKGGPKTTGPSAKTHGPSAKTSPVKSSPAKVTSPKTAPVKASSPKGPSTTKTTKAAAPTMKSAKADTKLAKVDAKSAKVEAKAAGSKKSTTTTTTSTTTSDTTTSSTGSTATTTTTTIDFTKGAVGEKLSKNSNLRSKVESRLKALGYEGTIYQAAYGFKNLGQFVAATNVSRNTGASFEQLKVQMTGLSVDADGAVLKANLLPDGTVKMVEPSDVTSPAPTKSLGQSIKTVKSSVDATSAATTATTQADAEIAGTSTTTVSR